MAAVDYAALKATEHAHQNKKYARTRPEETVRQTSTKEFESRFLTPIHEGGHARGLMFKRTVERLLEHDIRGKKVLDYCCGRGDLGIYLAMKGADVSGFDFSEEAIKIANRKAAANDLKAIFQVMDAEELSYPNDHFDFIIGFEALHHVIIHPRVPAELARVVKASGKIFFAENWGGDNPLFHIWRQATTLSRNRSAERGEVILYNGLVRGSLSPHFSYIRVEPLSLFYMTKKYLKQKLVLSSLIACDTALIRLFPPLRKYCGEAVITLGLHH